MESKEGWDSAEQTGTYLATLAAAAAADTQRASLLGDKSLAPGAAGPSLGDLPLALGVILPAPVPAPWRHRVQQPSPAGEGWGCGSNRDVT